MGWSASCRPGVDNISPLLIYDGAARFFIIFLILNGTFVTFKSKQAELVR